MNLIGLQSAGLSFVITAGTSLSALWSQPSIAKFTDVAQVSYGLVIIGGILAAAQTYKARLKGTPE